MSKNTDIEQVKPAFALVNERKEIVAQLLSEGLTRTLIFRHVTAKLHWKVDIKTVDRYINGAKVYIQATHDRIMKEGLSGFASRYETLYRLSVKKGDYRGAAMINKMCVEMLFGKPTQPIRDDNPQVAPSVNITINGDKVSLEIVKKAAVLPLPIQDAQVIE